MSASSIFHDGQADAMPCDCPACSAAVSAARSPFVVSRGPHRGVLPVKLCAVWCGDACTCGRGPESRDLDPVDIAGMRAIEGRAP